MKVFIEDDYESGTQLVEEPCWTYSSYPIEVSEEFFKEFSRIRDEYKEMQGILYKKYLEVKRKHKIEDIKKGIQSKGF